ncbi:heterokaryon incompatibility protein-domain-containing protein [Fusarium avenaceum]|nr:heterokaryon incompatibility protein-domain-containing protein [Fusarium avenaceum]
MEESTSTPIWEESHLCHRCSHVLTMIKYHLLHPPETTSGTKLGHYHNGSSLLVSAAGGCHLCSLLFGTSFLSSGSSVKQARSRLEALQSYTLSIKKAYRGQSSLGYYIGGPPEAVLELTTGELAGANTIYVIPRRNPSPECLCSNTQNRKDNEQPPRGPLCNSTGDSEALSLASWWLRKCLQEHPKCCDGSKYSESVRPARLIRVGLSNDNVQVIQITDDTEIPDFFALSYVWGTQECVTLTQATLPVMQQEIELHTLAKTIRDAIAVTRSLGYKYLWVDSLCIIQDSKADWKVESAKMGGIYRRSILTLGALHAAGNHEGLFTARNPLCARNLHIPGTSFEISNTANYVFWEYETRVAPLQTRAWVVQERASALRTLFFGATGLFWECSQCQASESDVQGSIDPLNPSWKRGINAVIDASDVSHRAAALVRIWNQIRFEYTQCNLTYVSDRPVAISGLADFLSNATGLKYSHGVWLDIAPADLCWLPTSIGQRVENKVSRIPAWSWLSVDKPVEVLLKSSKYFVVWRKSAELVGLPFTEASDNKPLIHTWPALTEAMKERPPQSLSFLTDFMKVYLLPDRTLTLTDPKANKSRSYDIPEKADGEAFDPLSQQYKWTPDIAVDSSITEAWFIHLAHFESLDGTRMGEAGIIAVNKSGREFERIGILKKWVFKDVSLCNYISMDGHPDTRYLPPNPFQKLENVVRLVHLI